VPNSNEPRVLLIAATTGYQTRSFAAAARRLGIDVTLATDRCHILEDPWHDSAIPIRFDEPDDSARTLSESAYHGIVAVADRPAVIAALTAERLGIPWHPPDAVAACRDKHRMREIFRAAGLPAPEGIRLPLDTEPHEIGFPCVLKPLGLSASRGVIRANNPEELAAALARIRRIVEHEENNRAVQIERYIDGREFALEGLMTGGELKVLAVFDKPDPLEGPFFEETLYVTPSRESAEVQNAILNATQRAVKALGLWHGPIHAEMRVNAEGVFMLEVAARPIGGLCARALRFTGGLTLEEVVIRHAIGSMPDELIPDPPASGVMMIPVPREGVLESVSGVEEARGVSGVDDVVITAKIGQKLTPLPEGASYTGFIFATGEEPAAVENALRVSHSRLRFTILGTLDVLPQVL